MGKGGKQLKAGQFVGVRKLSIRDKRRDLFKRFALALKPPEILDLDEWADANYKLPKETSSEHGQWKTSRFPFLRLPMKLLSRSSKCREFTVMKGAQLGFTEILKAMICYVADHCPAPMLYIQATKDAVEDFSTQKLEPTIEIIPVLFDKLGKGKPKGLKNEVTHKGFPGGYIAMGAASIPSFLRSKSVAYALLDEESGYPKSSGKEGSPVAMVRKRQANFPMSKMGRTSTPKFKETCPTNRSYLAGSQEQYYVPCPICNSKAERAGTYFVIGWSERKGCGSYLVWDKEKDNKTPKLDKHGVPTGIRLKCTRCGGLIPESKKTWMLKHGVWMSQKGSPGKPYEVEDLETRSLQISSLYSPLGFFSWRDAVKEWFEYLENKDKELHQVFINQTLGEPYSAAGQDISATWLKDRREEYQHEVPGGGLVLTAGVDVQQDRLEVDVTAWGLADQSWAVAYRVFQGDTELAGNEQGLDSFGRPTAWMQLDEFLMTTFKHESGCYMPIECTLIDSKYRTKRVHSFCVLREHRRIFPSIGRDGWGKGDIERPKRRSEEYKTWRFTLWVDELKSTVYSLLAIEVAGPGYQHFPISDDYSQKYFHGLTAENKAIKYVNGGAVLYWECPAHVRNEPLDCRVYALGALRAYKPNLKYRSEQPSPLPIVTSTTPGAEAGRVPRIMTATKSAPRQRKRTRPAKLF